MVGANLTQIFPLSFLLAAGIFLVGCGGAPSDDDIRSALQAQIEVVVGKRGGDMIKADLAKTKLIGCAKAEPPGYKCDWTGPDGSGSAWFVKSDSGWKLVGL